MSATERVMLDLETWGTTAGAAIESIGLVRFDSDGLGWDLHLSVSKQSCELAGLHIDAETQAWAHDNRQVSPDTLRHGQPLPAALDHAAAFLDDEAQIWAKPPAFDAVILAAAYRAVGRQPPWDHWRTRCVRTAADLAGDDWPHGLDRRGDKHNALDDARYQARQVVASGLLDGGAL